MVGGNLDNEAVNQHLLGVPMNNDLSAGSPPNMLTAMLSGTLPHVPPPAFVREHRMDDVRPAARHAGTSAQKPRDFTAADKALIRRVHGYMPSLQLLGILNGRLSGDVGTGAVLYTMDQLKAEVASVTAPGAVDGNDWGALRKLLAKARREGLLDLINEQVINDFAVVYSLNQKQVMTLKDIFLNGEGE